ncbi:MAG TPA: HPF/RaiA family ribosome-associated protein [Candidatus Kapabacteria bacterium]|nr:HPF/RaiA family ribosome-associated protein [Candidatus Kapabacteria bacterium]
MQIRINTDHVVGGHPAVVAPVSSMDDGALSRTGNHIAGMQVRLADENGDMRGPGDRRSVMEAGLEGRQPMAAMHRAGTMGASLPGQKFKGPS